MTVGRRLGDDGDLGLYVHLSEEVLRINGNSSKSFTNFSFWNRSLSVDCPIDCLLWRKMPPRRENRLVQVPGRRVGRMPHPRELYHSEGYISWKFLSASGQSFIAVECSPVDDAVVVGVNVGTFQRGCGMSYQIEK